MGKTFFLRLAINNLQRNKRMGVPFFIASVLMVSIYFMVIMLMHSDGVANVPAGRSIQEMFTFGFVIISILSVIFMFYLNSFLIKRRKKEFGLYGVLGLEKHHVGRVILWENLLVSTASLVLGIVSGSVFGRLIFMLLLAALNAAAAGSRFRLPVEAFLYTTAIFSAIFVLITFYNQLQVRLANPVDLLKGKQAGENKIRFVVPATLVGLVMLGWAYWTALTVNSALAALNKFMTAVIVVIPATMILFTTGSNLLLTLMRKNKSIYYRASNFIAIAGMFHRMKQNATGLAAICILSSMVLVTVSGTTALFFGQEDILGKRFPDDIRITTESTMTSEQVHRLESLITELADEYDVSIEDSYSYSYVSDALVLKEGMLSRINNSTPEEYVAEYQQQEEYLYDIRYIPLADFNRVTGRSEKLSADEMIFASNEPLGQIPPNVKVITGTKFTEGKNGIPYRTIFIAADEALLLQLHAELNSEVRDASFNGMMVLNIEGDESDRLDFASGLRRNTADSGYVLGVADIFRDRIEGYTIYGGLLFLGAFFTILFLTVTVLIIYFKQISEGYDDADRFKILQKVGMDDEAVKQTINRQILIVFFLPLLGALLHILAASKMIIKMLEVFSFYNVSLTILCITVTSLVFAVIYALVYKITAGTYYKLVRWGQV